MGWIFNIFYLLGLTLALPWILWRRFRRGKRLGGTWHKLTGMVQVPPKDRAYLWLHAVSVGEVLLLKPILEAIGRQLPNLVCILSVTTVTGREVAEKTYPGLTVFWFPFDFTWAVGRALRRVRPRLVLLAELELWPNFIRAAERAGTPVAVINGRMSQKSFQGYRRLAWFTRPMLRRVAAFAVQTPEYRERLLQLGVEPARISVTGSVKFDGVVRDRTQPLLHDLAKVLGIPSRSAACERKADESPLVWVVGSTQAPEEAWAVEIYREAVRRFPQLRLLLVPRHPERFEEVAHLLQEAGVPWVRRSELARDTQDQPKRLGTEFPVVLVNTLGELRTLWGLADLAFVGGSFNDRGGQNMIEPAAYGVPVMFGPNVWNFQQIADALLRKQAAVQVSTQNEWLQETLALLANEPRRQALGRAGQEFVASQQGATGRTLQVVSQLLDPAINNHRHAAKQSHSLPGNDRVLAEPWR
jgi:3-deoxy-D-manno-octulosonic-acid transferase